MPAGMKNKSVINKEFLKKLLRDADAGVVAASGDKNTASSSSTLADLLTPQPPGLSLQKTDGEGKDITGIFMDVDKAGFKIQSDEAALFEEQSLDGVVPSVAIDKFLMACDHLQSKACIAVLFGKEQKFGKGRGLFKRNIVNAMVCGFFEQLTLATWRCANIHRFVVTLPLL